MQESIRDKILDEVALEGLDGITLQGLWLRLSERLALPTPFSNQIKQRIWVFIQIIDKISIYQLPQPRDNLVIFRRNDYRDKELGYFVEPEDIKSIYPLYHVEEEGVYGSCQFYNERVDVTKNIKLLEIDEIIETWGENLHVLVAHQEIRYRTLVPNNANILFTPMQYCVLERIGRSRYEGESTVGIFSLQDMGETPKKLYYHRKALRDWKLITSQVFPFKKQFMSNCGRLHHLPRFFVELKPRALISLEKIVDFLKTKPDGLAIDEEIKQQLDNPYELKKYIRTSDYQRVLRDYKLPYRNFNPNAEKSDYQWKNGEEIMVRCFQLIDPNIDLNSTIFKENIEVEEEMPDSMCDLNIFMDLPLALQAYRIIEQHGSEGISQNDLGKIMGLSRLNSRGICRTLIRRNCVSLFLDNVGRQRTKKFIAKQFVSTSQLKKLMEEHNKMLISANQLKTETAGLKRPREDDNNGPKLRKKFKNDLSISSKNIIYTHIDGKNITTSIEHVLPESNAYANSFSQPITYKYLKRANFLINYIKNEKVFFNFKELQSQLQKINLQDDSDKNEHMVFDKKTIVRSLHRIAYEGHLKIYNVYLIYKNQVKLLTFYCDPSITHDHPMITTEIDRGKTFYFAATGNITKVPTIVQTNEPKVNVKILRPAGRTYGKHHGYAPKFLRMRYLHEFLFHLIYDFDMESIHTKAKAIETWKVDLDMEFDDELVSELPNQVYSLDLSWKTFVNPIGPIDWPKGWFLMTDVLFRLPLVLFTKLINVPYNSSKLTEYLKHPIKKYLPIEYLPEDIRHVLCYGRNYIYSVYQNLLLLCFIGVIQFGPHRFKEKDQVFIYLNRHASIWDTTSSGKGYVFITDKDYPIINYTFNYSKDVTNYWNDLMHYCTHTNLIISSRSNQKILVNPPFEKEELQETCKAHTVDNVASYDNGEIPGDHRGAGGLDSSLFSHINRNWSNLNQQKAKIKHSNISPSVILKSRLQMLCKRSAIEVKKRKTDKFDKCKVDVSKKKKEKRNLVERIHKKKNPFYDDIDREILKQKSEIRVTWSRQEDHILLLSKVACIFLDSMRKIKFPISFPLIRDCLHKILGSYSKTSRACQRRIGYMMKCSQTARSVFRCLEEITHSHEITSRFQKYKFADKSNHQIIFLALLKILVLKFSGFDQTVIEHVIPDSLEKFYEKFTNYTSTSTLTLRKIQYSNPKSIEEIQANAVSSVIHSSLSCYCDKTNWNLQLYKIYQNYPEELLRSVILNFKQSRMIAAHKVMRKLRIPLMNILSIPFHLSLYYKNHLITAYPYDLFYDTFLNLKQLHTEAVNSELYEYIGSSGGSAALLFEMGVLDPINLEIKIPENVILLDHRMVKDSDKACEQILKRCRHLFQNLTNPKDDADLTLPDITIEISNEPIPSTSFAGDDSNITLQNDAEDYEDKIYNYHEYFIVNSSRVFFTKLKTSNLISIKPDNYKFVLNKILGRSILNPEAKVDNDVVVLLDKTGANEHDILLHYQIISFVHNCQMFGTTYENLKSNFPMDKEEHNLSLNEILEILCDKQVIFKFGISDFVYVHRNHTYHWMVSSFKMKRLQNEAVDNQKSLNVDENVASDSKNITNIKVHFYPWIRVDGSINRRVLDRWLGCVLAYCLDKPGINVTQLCEKFRYLKPMETKILLEILLSLKCIKLLKIVTQRFSLFSPYKISSIAPAEHLDEKNVFIEADPQAITKLGAFIGDKQYKFDFALVTN